MVTDYKSALEGECMNAIGIDVSKGRSTVAIFRPFGEIVRKPFDVYHSRSGLDELAKLILSLEGESRVVLEHTGKYSQPVIKVLCEAGIFVAAVNAKLLHDFGGDTIRRDKNDRLDAKKIAGYCMVKWEKLKQYIPDEESRILLKTYNRQLGEFMKIRISQRNNLVSLTDQVFPGVNKLFTSVARDSDGHEKWADFLMRFWHAERISKISFVVFSEKYKSWCRKHGYNYSKSKADSIYLIAKDAVCTLPMNDFTKVLVRNSISQLNSLYETIAEIKSQMTTLAKSLPEYEIVIAMHGVGKTLAPQLIAEIGDIRKYPKRASLARFAGIEPPENQSGAYNQFSRRISKQGSPHLRRALFQVMRCVLQNSNPDEDTFRFISRKRSQNKPFKVYMIAGANKFLRIYYARVKELFDSLYPQETSLTA